MGAVIVDADRRIVSTGYNGFARGVHDDPVRYAERELKYQLIIHAERNALLFARTDLSGCELYTYPIFSCSECSSLIIQSKIARVVSPIGDYDVADRWYSSNLLARRSFDEAGVEYQQYDFP